MAQCVLRTGRRPPGLTSDRPSEACRRSPKNQINRLRNTVKAHARRDETTECERNAKSVSDTAHIAVASISTRLDQRARPMSWVRACPIPTTSGFAATVHRHCGIIRHCRPCRHCRLSVRPVPAVNPGYISNLARCTKQRDLLVRTIVQGSLYTCFVRSVYTSFLVSNVFSHTTHWTSQMERCPWHHQLS